MEAAISKGRTAPAYTKLHVGLVRVVIASALVAAGWADSAGAQPTRTPSPQVGQAMKQSCRPDYAAHCIGNDPAPPIAAACLAQFYINLSAGCRAALDAYNRTSSDR